MSIGSRLKEARLKKNLTQPELAAAIGITKGAIGNYETDVSSPKEEILIKLMKYLEIDANFVYQDFIDSDVIPPVLNEVSHEPTGIYPEEFQFIKAYRAADDRAREDAMRILLSRPREKEDPAAI